MMPEFYPDMEYEECISFLSICNFPDVSHPNRYMRLNPEVALTDEIYQGIPSVFRENF